LTNWIAVAALVAGVACVLVVLLTDALGRSRLRAGRRWQGCGILLELCGILASVCAGGRGWPAGRLEIVHHVTDALVLAGVALLAGGLAVQLRHGGKSLGDR
jgi:hypothetical protein